MRFIWRLALTFSLGISLLFQPGVGHAQATPNPPQINLPSFTGVYHLSRDVNGLSLLTAEETILAEFPGGTSFYGITRQLPRAYQGRSVDVKVLSVFDAVGNPIPYKTSLSDGNLVIKTGNPDIKIFGSQTFKINYQTKGVVNLGAEHDEFLLNVNGRGWDRPFGRVDAYVHIPSSFSASLKGDPSCYLALNTTVNGNCQINTQKTPQETTITSGAVNPLAHQALVIKMDFKSSTFTNKRPANKTVLIAAGTTILLVISTSSYLILRRKK